MFQKHQMCILESCDTEDMAAENSAFLNYIEKYTF